MISSTWEGGLNCPPETPPSEGCKYFLLWKNVAGLEVPRQQRGQTLTLQNVHRTDPVLHCLNGDVDCNSENQRLLHQITAESARIEIGKPLQKSMAV